jgi:hypothetical protein
VTTTFRPFRSVGTAALLLLAGCLGTPEPPLPPVRWFDPLPEAGRDGEPFVAVRVTAPPHLGRELCVRVGARELAFDAGNQWFVEPAEAVAVVAGRAFAGAADRQALELRVERFELDVTGPPRAHVRVVVLGDGELARAVEASADSAGRSPSAFAAAMAQALASLQRKLAGGG